MDDEEDCNKFYAVAQRSYILDSLKDTLNQMVDGYYIRKDTSDKILEEASRQFQNVLILSKNLFPKNYTFGQLAQYNYFDKTWVFNVKNPILFQYFDHKKSKANKTAVYPDHLIFDLPPDAGARTKTNLYKDIKKKLNSTNSKRFCFDGFLKIIAVEDSE